MLASLSLFVAPCAFARLTAAIRHNVVGPSEGSELKRYAPPRWHAWWHLPTAPREVPAARRAGRSLSWAQCTLLVYVGAFCTFHALYPLRHFVLYPEGVSWHEEGHLGAWHMKLR